MSSFSFPVLQWIIETDSLQQDQVLASSLKIQIKLPVRLSHSIPVLSFSGNSDNSDDDWFVDIPHYHPKHWFLEWVIQMKEFDSPQNSYIIKETLIQFVSSLHCLVHSVQLKKRVKSWSCKAQYPLFTLHCFFTRKIKHTRAQINIQT